MRSTPRESLRISLRVSLGATSILFIDAFLIHTSAQSRHFSSRCFL